MEVIKLRDEYIKLGQALKAANLVESGVDAKFAIQDRSGEGQRRWKPREEKTLRRNVVGGETSVKIEK